MTKMAEPTWFFVIQIFSILSVSIIHLGIGLPVSSEDPFGQQDSDRITDLPGLNFNLTFAQYSGYIKVNQDSGRALFYWFVEAAEDPATKPLLLWLNGGPGCSSIAYGLAEEIGPLHINADGKTLYLNPYSWNLVANVIFLDSPVGVGFSYSNTSSDLLNNGDKQTAEDSLEFLLKWFERFPQYKGRDFYISGESYGGHYVPQLSQAVVSNNLLSKEKSINLKGYLVGNALFDDHYDHLGVFQFLWSAGLISDQTHKQLHLQCDDQSFVHPSESCENILEVADNEIGNIDQYSIFTPPCPISTTPNRVIKKMHMIGRVSQQYDPCTEMHSVAYFNLPEVQQALHVDPAHAPSKWETCNELVNTHWKDSAPSVLDIYRELIHSGLRIWVFSGDTDAVLPTTSTRYSLDALQLQPTGPWQAWYDDGQVGGWIQEYEGLRFVSVRGAGHEVPLHKPKLALQLITSFLSGNSLPTLQLINDI